MYGLNAYATKQSIKSLPALLTDSIRNEAKEAYAYIIRWQGISSAKAVTALLTKNIKLRFSETPFISGGESFDRGSVIILKRAMRDLPPLCGRLWPLYAIKII